MTKGRAFYPMSGADAALLREAGLGPEDAAGRPWLVPLLRGYLLLRDSLAADLARDGRRPVCASGCAECCRQPIPVTPPEVMGLALFLKRQGRPLRPGAPPPAPCALLADGRCSVYPLRPIACRRYFVFGRRCAPEENPARDRPGEVLWPSRRALLQVLRSSAVWYEGRGLPDKNAAPELSFFAGRTLLLHEVNWIHL